MRRSIAGRWMGGVLAVLLAGTGAAESPVDPRVAHAQWLADSGYPYRAAAELARLPADSLSPAAAVRKAELQEAVDEQLAAALAPSGAAEQASRPQLEEALRQLAQVGDKAGEDVDTALGQLLDATEGSDAVARGLRDQAHLLLGRRAQERGVGEAAREHFRAVHSPGPYATEALLALGWSYLLPVDSDDATAEAAEARPVWAPITTPLRASSADGLAALRRSTPFRSASGVARSERAGDLEAALAVWQELIGRDPLDPAVQEGLLAIAYAYQHLGAQDQALKRYERTLEMLQQGSKLLDDALAHVDSGALLRALQESATGAPGGWPWWAVERRASQWWRNGGRDVPALYYAGYLMADARFRALAQRVQLLTVAADRMEAAQQAQSGSAASRARAAAAGLRPELRSQERALQARASELMTSRLTLTERYMAEAHFALARMRDPGVSDVAAGPVRAEEVEP